MCIRDSLHIEPGETVAIMGPTGSGKTSLINLIPRFTDVSEGEVKVDGIKVGLYPLHKLRGSIGLATQDVFLFSDTVDGNIAYGDTSLSCLLYTSVWLVRSLAPWFHELLATPFRGNPGRRF